MQARADLAFKCRALVRVRHSVDEFEGVLQVHDRDCICGTLDRPRAGFV